MVPKKKRVTKEIFQKVITNGRTLSSPLFLFRYIPSKTTGYSFVASKKVAKNAVDRAYLRRIGYAAYKKSTTKNGYISIFFYKKTPKTPKIEQLKEIGRAHV